MRSKSLESCQGRGLPRRGGGLEPAADGNENMKSAPSVMFLTADKPINIAANRDAYCVSLATNIDRRDLLEHADYKTREH